MLAPSRWLTLYTFRTSYVPRFSLPQPERTLVGSQVGDGIAEILLARYLHGSDSAVCIETPNPPVVTDITLVAWQLCVSSVFVYSLRTPTPYRSDRNV